MGLVGLRRTGKTTLMLKVVEDALREGFDPLRILYFSFDEARARIRELLRAHGDLTGKEMGEGKSLVLLDEIQKLEGWEEELKALYDLHKGRIKFLISGSGSPFVRRGLRETLAGRFFEFRVHPLSFREYLRFRSVECEPLELHEGEVRKCWGEFVRTQGFPELVGVQDRLTIRKYLKESVVERVILRDLPSLPSLRDLPLLESLLNLLMEEPGQLLHLSELAGEVGISRKTLSKYLFYLEQSFLLRKLYNFSGGRRKTERKLKKYYPAVLSPDLTFREDEVHGSKVFEWVVISQLRPDFFWRDPYGNEVDAVLGEEPLPVEARYGKVEVRGLLRFMEKFGVKQGYVLTPDLEERREVNGKTIWILPAFKFLLRGT